MGLCCPLELFFCRFYAKPGKPICESGASRLQNRDIYKENEGFLRIPGQPAKLMNFGVPICVNYVKKKFEIHPIQEGLALMGDCRKLTWLA